MKEGVIYYTDNSEFLLVGTHEPRFEVASSHRPASD